jgi:DNA mismatch repair ATPase MutS
VPIDRDGPTQVIAAWHPEIAEPVANDVELVPGRGIIITGAHMSGKSTYLRTIGIAAVMARTIHTVPAERCL